jgi:3-dehydroquinate synthase
MKILHTVTVGLGERSYPIHIGRGLMQKPAELLPFDPAGRTLFILADQNVGAQAEMIGACLREAGAGTVNILSITGGERAKSLSELENVLSWLPNNNVDRQSVLFAVGGGVIGDLAGFAAAVIMRGISFVQVPTTLLAQVDSSVGGKTGINMQQGKNMVGAFHQPVCVLSDLEALETLPRRELLAGYAEIIKYGLINDPEFFVWLEKVDGKVAALDIEATARAVATSCRKKAEIVAADETEQGRRALLNLGHTFGHALEAAAGYDGRLLHGEAVAIGMVLAFQLSVRLGHCPQDDADRVKAHLKASGLPVSISSITPKLAADADRVIEFMKHDKKAAAGKMVFILAHGIGKAFISREVPLDDVRHVIQHSLQEAA